MRVAAMLVAAGCAIAFTACESTQDKSARLAKQGKTAFAEKGLKVTKRSASVEVRDTTVLEDKNGAAVVVEVENTGNRALTSVPVAVNVLDKAGKALYSNDAPGLEPSLTTISVLEPGEKFAWVNDQVATTGVAKAKAEIGVQKAASDPKALPRVKVGAASLRADPVSGIEATGYLLNDSKVEQRNVFVFCVARKGGRIVAAGRSRIERVKAGRRGRFHIFFIGDPRGAKLEIKAPPTVLKPES